MRPSRSTSATSPRRDAPSSIAQRALSASALSPSISTALPASKRTRRFSITVPETSRGLVAVTTPSTRSGSGVDAISSVGRFGACTTPSTVCIPGVSDAKREVGSSPTVSSVPGPWNRSASNRCASIRLPASCNCASRTSQAAAASGSSRRRTKTSCSQSFAIAVSSSRPGWTRRAHSGTAHGTTVQFVVRALITSKFSAWAGSPSRPARAGSIPSSSPGGTCGVIEMRTPWPSPSCSNRRPYHGGTKSSVSSGARSRRIRLTNGSKYHGSTNLAPRS